MIINYLYYYHLENIRYQAKYYILPASIPDTNAPIDICVNIISNKNRDKPKLIFLSG